MMRKRPEPLTRERRASGGYLGAGLYVNFDFRLSPAALAEGFGWGDGDSVLAAADLPGAGVWWDVAPAEVSTLGVTVGLRAEYESDIKGQRWFG